MSAPEALARDGLVLLAAIREALALEGPIVAFDLETTGTTVATDRIVEIALLHVAPDGAGSFWQSLVHPEGPIPEEATKIHGITDADVQDQPTFRTRAPELLPFFLGAVPVGFNVKGFDVPLLLAEFARSGCGAPTLRAPLDPLLIFRQKEPHDLSHAMNFYVGHPHANAHNALADTAAAVEVLAAQLRTYADLPRTASALADYCVNRQADWLDPDGRLVWRDGEARLAFGKYTGKSLRMLVKNEPAFLHWMLGRDFTPEVKRIVRHALAGTFPTEPSR